MEQTETAGWPGASPSGTVTLGGTPLPLVGRARVYACGITPYDVTHVGHAATFVWIDTLARVLRDAGADVVICRNVTDVDDVLLAAADRAGAPYDRFAAIQQFYFDRDMAALGVGQPAQQPRAHAYIGQAIALAAGLLERGAAYERAGQVWFRGAAAAHAAVPDRERALRLAAEYGDDPADESKDDPFDVAVWRVSHGGEPGWASPWGTGRPGWHAECAAMALHAFGPAVDVQAGGGDLCFPHHACQAAMAEAFTGVTPFARVRFNVGVVRVAGAKMAKSTGNLVLVSDLLKEHSAAAVRLLILARRWGRDWDFSPAGLDAAEARLERLQAAAGRPDHGVAGSGAGGSGAAAVAATRAALAGDLDVPAALRIAEDEGGQAARSLGALLGLW
ncbi:MAG TPA: class I tRNA ligase family protein [Streptosporangiaceae bacterium]|nr:class I tRNA ligase family protein [Streptosporangiaceae bacterium]